MLPWLMGFSKEDKQSGRFGGDTAVANMQVVATAESGGHYSHWSFRIHTVKLRFPVGNLAKTGP